jgi:hypothetical protein
MANKCLPQDGAVIAFLNSGMRNGAVTMPKTSAIEYSRTLSRRAIAFSLLILLAFLALTATGCRQGGQSPGMPGKASLAMAGDACEDGLMREKLPWPWPAMPARMD